MTPFDRIVAAVRALVRLTVIATFLLAVLVLAFAGNGGLVP